MWITCEIIICEVNEKDEVIDKVELWKDDDGYPEYIVEMIKEFSKFAQNLVGKQIHWLGHAQDVASMLIAYDYELRKKYIENLKPEDRESYLKMGYLKPDIRPRGSIEDAEYVYVLLIWNKPTIAWRLYIYHMYVLRRRHPDYNWEWVRNHKNTWDFIEDTVFSLCEEVAIFTLAQS